MACAGFGLAAAVGISGCGASSGGTDSTGAGDSSGGDPKAQVVSAFQSFEDASNAGFTLKLDSTVEDIQKINAAQDDTDQMSASDLDALEKVLSGSLTMNMSAPDGKTFGELQDSAAGTDSQNLLTDPQALEAAMKDQGSFAMSVVLDGSGLVDFVTKDGILYLRADADKIADLADQDISSATSMLGQLPSSISTPAQALLDGDWISLDLVQTVKVLDEQGLLDELAAQDDASMADAALNQAKLESLVASLQAAIESDAQITETDDGYQVSVPYEQTADAIQDDLVDLLGKQQVNEFRKELKKAPSDNFVFDVSVDDDKLTGINVDLVQFMEESVDATFAVDLAIDPEAEAVQVPGSATAVDIDSIMSLGLASQF